MSSKIKQKVPELKKLLKRLENDPHWKDFGIVYDYFDKITFKLINEFLDNIPETQEDYRLYLFDFLLEQEGYSHQSFYWPSMGNYQI